MGGRGTASIGQGSQRLLRCFAHGSRSYADTSDGVDATRQYYQPRRPLPAANISPLYKFTKKNRIARSSKTSPHSIRQNPHITLMTTKHSMCSSQVRCYVLQWPASLLTSTGLSSIIFSEHLTLPPTYSSPHLHTYRFVIADNTLNNTMDHSGGTRQHIRISSTITHLPTRVSPNLPQVYTTTPAPLPLCPSQTPHAPPPLKHQHDRKATTITNSISLPFLSPNPSPSQQKTFQHAIASDESVGCTRPYKN